MNLVIHACGEQELADGEMRAVEHAPQPLAICRVGSEWFAFENNCSHEEFALTEGALEGTEVECPLHGARFCVRTGAVLAIPASCAIKVFPVRLERGEVLVELPSADSPSPPAPLPKGEGSNTLSLGERVARSAG